MEPIIPTNGPTATAHDGQACEHLMATYLISLPINSIHGPVHWASDAVCGRHLTRAALQRKGQSVTELIADGDGAVHEAAFTSELPLPAQLQEYFDNWSTPYPVDEMIESFSPFLECPGRASELAQRALGSEDVEHGKAKREKLTKRACAHLGKSVASPAELLRSLSSNNYVFAPAIKGHVNKALNPNGSNCENANRPGSDWLRVKDAAAIAGVTSSAISHACRKGQLKYSGKGFRRRISPESLRALYPKAFDDTSQDEQDQYYLKK